MTHIFTIGYAHLTLPLFHEWVHRHNAIVIDTRLNPYYSNHADFRFSVLSVHLGKQYRSVTAWGNRAYRGGTQVQIADYDKGLLQVRPILATNPVVLLCGCSRVERCHRRVLAERLAADTGLDVTHLTFLLPSPSTDKTPIYGLTLMQPWAWVVTDPQQLFCDDPKTVENRDYPLPPEAIGVYIALHAGRTYDHNGAFWIEQLTGIIPPSAQQCVQGSIVAVARLTHCFDAKAPHPLQSRWVSGRYLWVLSDLVTLRKPVPCRGAQYLWSLPPDTLNTVRTQYKESHT